MKVKDRIWEIPVLEYMRLKDNNYKNYCQKCGNSSFNTCKYCVHRYRSESDNIFLVDAFVQK